MVKKNSFNSFNLYSIQKTILFFDSFFFQKGFFFEKVIFEYTDTGLQINLFYYSLYNEVLEVKSVQKSVLEKVYFNGIPISIKTHKMCNFVTINQKKRYSFSEYHFYIITLLILKFPCPKIVCSIFSYFIEIGFNHSILFEIIKKKLEFIFIKKKYKGIYIILKGRINGSSRTRKLVFFEGKKTKNVVNHNISCITSHGKINFTLAFFL